MSRVQDFIFQRNSQHTRLLAVALWSALIFGTLILISLGKSFFIPLVVAMIAVYLIHAVSRAIQTIPWIGRYLPKACALALSFIAIFFLGYGLFSLVAVNTSTVAMEAPRYQHKLMQLQSELFAKLEMQEPQSVADVLKALDAVSPLTTVATGLASLLSNVLLILLYSLFMLLEVRFIPTKLAAIFPEPHRRDIIENLITRIDKDIQTYLGVKTLLGVITALLSYVVMRVVGLDFAEFWAVLIFVLNFIPTIGSIFATIFPCLLALVQFDSAGIILFVILGLIAVQQLMGSIIEPNIMGESLNISPLVVFVSLILWGILWGIVGMFLCVPITVILVIILSNFEKTRWVAVLLSKNGSLRIHAKMPSALL